MSCCTVAGTREEEQQRPTDTAGPRGNFYECVIDSVKSLPSNDQTTEGKW